MEATSLVGRARLTTTVFARLVHFVPDRADRTLAEDHFTYRSHQTPDFLLRAKLIQLIAIHLTRIGATQKLSRPLAAP
jgi:hypothetical protein